MLREEAFHVNKNKFMLHKKIFPTQKIINLFRETSPYSQKQFERSIEQIH